MKTMGFSKGSGCQGLCVSSIDCLSECEKYCKREYFILPWKGVTSLLVKENITVFSTYNQPGLRDNSLHKTVLKYLGRKIKQSCCLEKSGKQSLGLYFSHN
jgi:hypothetical protein